jgi:ElaA protein
MSQINWFIKDFASLDRDDLYKIIQLRNAVFVVEQNCVYQDADGKDDKAWHLFAKDGDKVIAYARLFKTGDYFDKASIGRVVVDPEYRGQDLGKTLMQKAMTFIFENLDENTIEISAQTYLEQFYRDLGFIPYGEPYLEDGIPHIRMVAKK